MEKLKPMISPSRVSVAARIKPKSSRSSSSRVPALRRNHHPIHAESHSATKESAKTVTV
jgi:hypothetical protein